MTGAARRWTVWSASLAVVLVACSDAAPATRSTNPASSSVSNVSTTTTLPAACLTDVANALSSPSDVAFWRQQINYLDWIRFAPSFEQLHAMADVSVVANVAGVRPAESIDLGDGMFVSSVLIDLEVVIDVKGTGVEEVTVMVETPSSFDPGGPLTYDQWFDEFAQQVPSGAAYFALAQRPDIVEPVYQPISGLSIWVQSANGLEPGFTQYESERDRTPGFWVTAGNTATLAELACQLAMT